MRYPLLITLVLFLFSCGRESEKPSTALDTGSAFIRASLDGDFKSAESLLLSDTQNLQFFETYKVYYEEKIEKEKKAQYKNASFEINKYLELDDSTTIINYSNQYMVKPMEIKVVRKDNEWKIDFKYTYSGNLPIN